MKALSHVSYTPGICSSASTDTSSSAVLQDPSVSTAPIEQKLSFLRSKNLTQEEVDASLARVGLSAPSTAQAASYPPQQYRPQQQQYAYPPQYYGQAPPSEPPPHRDWRDYFITATVATGVGYALYWTARRYIAPLIAPPTPPQLEQDKAAIDASFEKTFALLEQLSTDTKGLKDAESARKERLDAALAEVESVVGKMKEANEARETEAKRWGREMEDLRNAIPEAIRREREGTEGKLRDLATEMKSLKTLVGNRMGQQPAQGGRTWGSTSSGVGTGVGGVNGINGISGSSAAAVPEVNGTPAPAVNGSSASDDVETPAPQPSVLPERSASASPYGSKILSGKSPQIPLWQREAKKRSEEAAAAAAAAPATNGGTSESGTMTSPQEGEAGA